jgi:hypothetical protein
VARFNQPSEPVTLGNMCTGCGIVGADARPNWKEQPERECLTGVQWRS